MPRQARLDAPGILHHVIVRGIEKRRIFVDRWDRDTTVPFTIPAHRQAGLLEAQGFDMLCCLTQRLGLICYFCPPDQVRGRLGS